MSVNVGDRLRHKLTQETVKVRAIAGSRVQVLNQETGNREWIEQLELDAVYRMLPRINLNPS